MKTSHSSLLADTGLSEIELDRMGLIPVSRDGNKLIPYGINNPMMIARHLHTLPPFENTQWYDDDDVQTVLRWEYMKGTGMRFVLNHEKLTPFHVRNE